MPSATRFSSFHICNLKFVCILELVICYLLFVVSPIYAQNPIEYPSQSSTVTATIPEFVTNPPTLIAPQDESVTKNPYEPFVFTRSTPGTYIDHYDLYLDDVKVAGEISHSALSQDAYFFTMERTGETINLHLKNIISDGYHSWRVTVYSNSGRSATSDTWQFWVDSQSPIIILEQVEDTHVYWSTNDPYNIPPRDQRNFIVDTPNPYLAGKIEAYSNLKLSLVCPNNAPTNCQNQSITVYQPTGVWQHRFRGILENVTYLVYLFATDSAGNTNSLPEFSITYIKTPSIIEILFPTITPTPSLSPTPTVISPTPTLPTLKELEPSFPLIITPPEAPPPPPPPAPTPPPPTRQSNLLLLIAIIALILHLVLLTFSQSTKIIDFFKLLPSLLIPPFLKKYNHLSITSSINLTPSIQFSESMMSSRTTATMARGCKPREWQGWCGTLPFTKIFPISLDTIKTKLNTLMCINPHQLFSLLRPLIKLEKKYILTNSAGEFNLQLDSNKPYVIFAQKPGFIFPPSTSITNHLPFLPNTTLYFGQILAANSKNNHLIVFLDPKSKDLLNHLERLQILSWHIRAIPLLATFLTCFISLFLLTSPLNLLILSLAIMISINEYLYPFVETRQIQHKLNR
jgi:hypothetical protein